MNKPMFSRSIGPFVLLGLVASAQGCNRCSTKDPKADAAPPLPSAISVAKEDLLPPPAPWTFKPARLGPGMPSFALPQGCTLREPTVHASVAASTKFVATSLGLGTLVVADADPKETPPKLVGVAGVLLDPQGASKEPAALPWTDAAAMPRIARSKTGSWFAAFTHTADEQPSEVFVYQNNKITSLGEGDRFDAVDMLCGNTRCALLTTRKGNVLALGASVVVGSPDEPVASWKNFEITPSAGDSNVRPSILAAVDPKVIVAMIEGQELVFFEAESSPAGREIGRVQAPHGIIDATMTDAPLALVYGAEVDDEGCAREGGKIHISRPGKEPIEIRAHAPPTSGSLRTLAQGTLATYLAPLGCGQPRKVVYAVVLDPAGSPVSAPMPIADAQSYAAASDGENVDIWIQLEDDVTWLRARCATPSPH